MPSPSQRQPTPSPKPPTGKSRGKRGPKPHSTAIAANKAVNALNAFAFADQQGIPLNTAISVTAQGSPIYGSGRANAANTDAFRTAIQAVVKAVARHFRVPSAYILVMENPPGGGHGLNAHLLTHGPDNDAEHADYRAALAEALESRFRWQSSRDPDRYKPFDIKPSRRGFLEAHRALEYMSKGADDTLAEARLQASWLLAQSKGPCWFAPQGTIYGKRLTVSHNIGDTERRQAGYVDRVTLDDLNRSEREWKARSREQLRAFNRQAASRHTTAPAPTACHAHPAGEGAGRYRDASARRQARRGCRIRNASRRSHGGLLECAGRPARQAKMPV